MKIGELAKEIKARVLIRGPAENLEIRRVCAGDRMSDLLSEAGDGTLLVTHVANMGLVRLLELMDVPGICLVKGANPDDMVLEAAKASGAALMVSREGMFETCGLIYSALRDNEQRRRSG